MDPWRIAASPLPLRKDVEYKIKVALEVWRVGQYVLSISLLLDTMINQGEGQ
jgi:hypothetical protein